MVCRRSSNGLCDILMIQKTMAQCEEEARQARIRLYYEIQGRREEVRQQQRAMGERAWYNAYAKAALSKLDPRTDSTVRAQIQRIIKDTE